MKPLAQNTLIQNRYLVVHLIGKGGMGEVYLAVDQRLGSAVALKRTYFAGDEMLGNAFEREARTLARMRHPVLPKVSDHFGEGEEQYLVMEHIAGDDLAKRLEAAQKPFPVSWVMFWADQLLDALSYLHSHEPPIIHRDIKPQNLKLTDENHIILLDFGLSKTSTGQTHISNSGSTGSVVGYTPHYAPMEQIRGIGTNPRSDLYSLSATLYQLMTNVVPADALSRADTMLNGLSDSIEPPHLLNPEIPASVSEVILKGMEVSQEKRFGNARDMQKAMRRAFTKMQEAMAAQTVAFNMGDMEPMAAAVDKTKLMPSQPMEAPAPDVRSPSVPPAHEAVDLDATLAFDPAENLEHVRQAGARTEAYQPAESNGGVAMPTAPIPVAVEEEEDRHTSFVTVVAGSHSANADGGNGLEAPAAAAVVTPPVKKSGRTFALLGGLAAFLVLGAGAAAAGWYFYTNYYAPAAAVVEPAPSPEPVSMEQPQPQVTTGAAVDTNISTNSNTTGVDAALVDSNTNNQANTDQTIPGRNESDSSTASRQNPAVNRSTSRSATPAAKPKQKPKSNPGRTDILQ